MSFRFFFGYTVDSESDQPALSTILLLQIVVGLS